MLKLEQEARPITRDYLRLGGTNPEGETLAFTNYYLTRNGRAHIPVMGSSTLRAFHASIGRRSCARCKLVGSR